MSSRECWAYCKACDRDFPLGCVVPCPPAVYAGVLKTARCPQCGTGTGLTVYEPGRPPAVTHGATLRKLLEEVWIAHCDRGDTHYLACEKEPCAWCEDTKKAIDALDTAWDTLTRAQQEAEMEIAALRQLAAVRAGEA